MQIDQLNKGVVRDHTKVVHDSLGPNNIHAGVCFTLLRWVWSGEQELANLDWWS